jgi:hypothetical protein
MILRIRPLHGLAGLDIESMRFVQIRQTEQTSALSGARLQPQQEPMHPNPY